MQFQEYLRPPRERIGSLTYQSVAAKPPTDAELDDLVIKARARNHSLGVTGMLLYEDGKFLQTLEGPPAQLGKVWTSIQRDERHGDIDVLSEQTVPGRLFSGWDLLLYRRRERAAPGVWGALRRKDKLSEYIETAAKLALEADEAKLSALLAKLAAKDWTGEDMVRQLLEPVARYLGDAWLADDCSEFDLTMGLGMLQRVGHTIHYERDPGEFEAGAYRILLATAPGEPHMLGTSLLADQFVDGGWDVEVAFPGSNDALINQLLSECPDAVDIALSDALPRHGRITALRDTVRRARAVLPEQQLIVSVGGRLFAEAGATAEHVGADHARACASGTRSRIGDLVSNAKPTHTPD
ncbi:MAG: BLUF domain-containing protein [Pseudomonadota bacterium]